MKIPLFFFLFFVEVTKIKLSYWFYTFAAINNTDALVLMSQQTEWRGKTEVN